MSAKNKKYLKELRSSYSQAEPNYMKSGGDNFTNPLKNIYTRVRHFTKLSYKLLKLITQRVQGKELVEDARNNIHNYSSITRRILRKILPRYYKYTFSNHYNSLSASPRYSSSKYIYFPLHYQPERTTSPEGGRYVHQYLVVKMLSSATPDEISIFVKEHPSQFRSRLQGEVGRSIEYYDDLDSIQGVELVSIDSNPFKLIDNSEAVATVTGTPGWEALVRGIPSMVFGNAWYRSAPGCYYVKNMSQLEKVIKEIQEDNQASVKEIDKFVAQAESKTYEGEVNTESNENEEVLYRSFCENTGCIEK